MNKVFTQITLRIDPQLLERIQDAADDLQISRAQFFIQALTEKLEKEGEK